jgi:hypothetical protein
LRKTLLMVLTLFVVLTASVTSVPRAEAETCGWHCNCYQFVCDCTDPDECGRRPSYHCPGIPCV